MDSSAGQLDTHIEIVTPENIAFRYRVAGPFRRLPAYLIDVAIRVGVFIVAGIALAFAFGISGLEFLGQGLILVIWFVLTWFYGGVFETFWNGQTPGKRLMQIRVVSVDGNPINGLQAVLRNILRVLDGQPGLSYVVGPFTYVLGLLAAASNDRFQRLGDLVCGTMVVVEERSWLGGVVRIGEPEADRMVASLPVGFQPSRTLSRALSAYVQRRRNFSYGRRLEIARHLGEPLRRQFNLPPNTDLDLLLCALYQRTFLTETDETEGDSPFAERPLPVAQVETPFQVMERLARR